MSTLYVEYAGLECAAEGMTNLAEQLTTYANNLTNRISNQFSEVEGGSSDYLNSASYFIEEKIKSLTNKADQFSGYAKKITAFTKVARRADQAVADFIQTGYDTFTDQKGIDQPAWKETMVSWMCWLRENSILFDGICSMIETIGDKTRDLLGELRYWYQCEGGKQMVELGMAVVGAIAAVLVFIAALPALATISGVASAIFAVAGVVGSFLGMADAIANLVTSIKANRAFKNGDMAWSKLYGEQDKVSDTIRATNYGKGWLNRAADMGANGLDFVKGVCDIIGGVEGLKKIASKVQCVNNYFNNSTGLKRYLGNIQLDNRGKEKITYTFKSVKDGLWKFFKDLPADPEVGGDGIRTVLNENFRIDFDDGFKSLSWEGIKDTLRYKRQEARAANMFKFGNLDDAAKAKKANAWRSFNSDYVISAGTFSALIGGEKKEMVGVFLEAKKMKNWANSLNNLNKHVGRAGKFVAGQPQWNEMTLEFVKKNTLSGQVYASASKIVKSGAASWKGLSEIFKQPQYRLPDMSQTNAVPQMPFGKVSDMPSIEQMKFEASSIPRSPVVLITTPVYPAA